EINQRRDTHCWCRPVGPAEMSRRERVSGKRGDHRPAAQPCGQRCYRGSDIGAAGRTTIDQRKWHFAPAMLAEALEHALARQRSVFRREMALPDRGPGRHIVERIASGARVGRPEEQLYRRRLAREPGEMASEFG